VRDSGLLDHCGGPITDCTMANMAYDLDAGGPFELVHKDCTWAYDAQHLRKGMDEMPLWLMFLEGNVGFTEEVRRKARGTVKTLVQAGLMFGKVR
jgi:hypothetical protein